MPKGGDHDGAKARVVDGDIHDSVRQTSGWHTPARLGLVDTEEGVDL